MYVKGYHNGDEMHLYKGKEKKIKSNSIFSNSLLPQDRRFDMLVLPMFSGEEQYGLLLAETRQEHFMYATQIASQVSVSIEVLEIIKKQNAIKKELERNLAETVANNRVLDEMSRSDHLTGVLNRRGFLNTARQIIGDEANYGKRAIAIYADMDNLKIINDEFGHDEGDYSLKTIAQALTESFRQSDLVARMGGDEFAAFA
ncbi:MAG: GGDEF domain-containing protein, partial [Lachnospiraceae bacterium]|nr:GGDEF domain-containing protein [Lachnospiraceae bacterium]